MTFIISYDNMITGMGHNIEQLPMHTAGGCEEPLLYAKDLQLIC